MPQSACFAGKQGRSATLSTYSILGRLDALLIQPALGMADLRQHIRARREAGS